MGTKRPDLIFKSIVPIIMAGILGIYGLIVAVILQGTSKLSFHSHFILVSFEDYRELTVFFSYFKRYLHIRQGLEALSLRTLLRSFITGKHLN